MVRLVAPLGLALVLFVTLLSGCFGTEELPPDVDEDPVGVVTDPGDFSYLKDGMPAGSHAHDYWKGQDTREVLHMVGGCGNGCSASYSGSERGGVVGSFRPQPDSIVPQGTAVLNITATWSIAGGSYGDIVLYVKTANMTGTEFVGNLEQGVPFEYTSTNQDNDPPHHRLSLWRFEVRAHPPAGTTDVRLEDYEVTLHVVAERGLPIPVYPPHPDLWDGATELLLHESSRTVPYQIQTPTMSMCSGCLGRHVPDEGMIVPYDASYVEVTVEVAPGSLPQTLELMYHGADTWDHAAAPLHEDGPLRAVWRIPVEGKPDSPYAAQSLWEFFLVNDAPGVVKAWTGSYDITIKAVK